jgi:hypothetical protein
MSGNRITRVKDWPEDEQPRERLLKNGAASLSDAQLLAIIIKMGKPGSSALDLALELLARFGSLSGIEQAGITEICEVPGIGKAKAAEIKAAIELGRRHQKPSLAGASFCSSEDVASYYRPRMKDLKEEMFRCALLDTKNKIIRDEVVSIGSLTSSIVHPGTPSRPRSGNPRQRSSSFTTIPAATQNRVRRTFCSPGGSSMQERSSAPRCSIISSSGTEAISAFGRTG